MSSPASLAWLASLALVSAGFVPGDDTEGDTPANPHDLHARAPRTVQLEVLEDDKLLAAGWDYAEVLFERLSEEQPERFSFDEEEEYWVDSEGEYEYDAENEVYWQNIPAEVLSRGRADYVQFCASCHGFEGDGYGRSARALRPPPRDFRQALFKFTKTDPAALPSDAALHRIIENGLHGTPMYPWDIDDGRIDDIIQYIKSLSPRGIPEGADEDDPVIAAKLESGEWRDEPFGWRDPYNDISDRYDIGADPWEGREREAIAAGEKIYHEMGCYNCHPAYLPVPELNELLGAEPGTTYRENLSYSKIVDESSYLVLGEPVAIMPPDFTWHPIRTGGTAKEIGTTLRSGIAGAGMPAWALEAEDLYAVGHYIRSLIEDYKENPDPRARMEFMRTLR